MASRTRRRLGPIVGTLVLAVGGWSSCSSPPSAPVSGASPTTSSVAPPAVASAADVPTPPSTPAANPRPPGTQVTLELDKPPARFQLEMNGYVVEEIAENPDDPKAYPGGSGVVLSFKHGSSTFEFSDLSTGYQSQRVVWKDGYRIELVRHDSRGPTAVLALHQIDSEAPSTVLVTDKTVKRGQSLTIDDELVLEFKGHSHKSVYQGQSSPLIVSVRYGGAKGAAEEQSYNLEDSHPIWQWRDYRFRIKSFDYDHHMVLDVERLALTAAQ